MLEGLFGMLVFLGTLLGLGVCAILLVVALLTRRGARAARIAALALGWVAIYVLVLLAVSFTSRPAYLAPGQERCFDEMCYSVQAVATAHTLGAAPNALTAQGDYVILILQLRSAAKGTAQKPSEPDLFMIDARGQRYSPALNAGSELNLPLGQPVTGAQLWSVPVPPGESLRRTVAFDLPAGLAQPALVISEGIGPLSAVVIGDEGSLFHAKTEFLLK